ncbi:MBL fold metallo-hydrolase [Brevifollis gellanilyticus]|nr:MBL fold metallo-hydrolase [Brevifollis gellanilyticus]
MTTISMSMFTGGIAQTNGYLVKLPGGMLLVDAPDGIVRWLKQEGAKVDAVLLTHQHFDHVLDAAAVAREHGCPVYCWEAYSPDLTLERLFKTMTGSAFAVPEFAVDHVLNGKTEIEVLGQKMQLFHVPGHSPDSVCFYLESQGVLFGGDVLFLDGVGRTDFPGGSFEQLATGIENHLWPLPDMTVVFPGHGDETTIGREREENPFVGAGA